ncbi:MAG: DUF1707 SHOCT-like domain-containing protein [Acidimicrobiales bacterium]
MRIGDAERSKVGDELSRHFAEGRLDEAELNERLNKAMSAKVEADLAGLLSDLPGPQPPQATGAGRPSCRPRRSSRVLGLVLAALLALSLVPWLAWPFHLHAHGGAIFLIFLVALLVWRRRHRHLHRFHHHDHVGGGPGGPGSFAGDHPHHHHHGHGQDPWHGQSPYGSPYGPSDPWAA